MTWTQDHVHIKCSDYEATVRFFVENLDAKEEDRVNTGGRKTVTLRIGDSLYKFSPKRPGEAMSSSAEPPHNEVYHLGFKTNDLWAKLAKMKARGVKVTQDLARVNPQLQYAFIEGPDGSAIELLQQGG